MHINIHFDTPSFLLSIYLKSISGFVRIRRINQNRNRGIAGYID